MMIGISYDEFYGAMSGKLKAIFHGSNQSDYKIIPATGHYNIAFFIRFENETDAIAFRLKYGI